MKSKLRLFVALILFICFVGCVRTVPLENPSFSVASQSVSKTSKAIDDALKNRGWVLVKNQPGKKVARYSRSSHSATIEIKYSKQNVDIKLLDSTDLEHGYNKRGEEVIHKAYSNWVKYLEKDISVNISYM